MVPLDNWLVGLDERTGKETVKERFQYEKIIGAFKKILKKEGVYPPVYDPKTRLIINKKGLQSIYLDKGICIADGVVSLDIKGLRRLSDLKIFVEIDDYMRIKRLKEFYIDYKKCPMDETNKIISKRELEEVFIIKKSKKFADFVYFPYGCSKKGI